VYLGNEMKEKNFNYLLDPVGFVRSSLRARENAPRQAYEGAPEAFLELKEAFAPALHGITVGDEIIVIKGSFAPELFTR